MYNGCSLIWLDELHLIFNRIYCSYHSACQCLLLSRPECVNSAEWSVILTPLPEFRTTALILLMQYCLCVPRECLKVNLNRDFSVFIFSHSWFHHTGHSVPCANHFSTEQEQILQTGSLCKRPAGNETMPWLMKSLRYSMNCLQFPNVRACHSRPLPLIKRTGKRQKAFFPPPFFFSTMSTSLIVISQQWMKLFCDGSWHELCN